MQKFGFWALRVLAAVLLAGLLVGGGFYLFWSGQASGYAMGQAAALQVEGSTGSISPFMYGGMAGTMRFWPVFFYPHLGCLPMVFGLFLFFFLFRIILGPRWRHAPVEGGWRGRYGWRHGPCGHPWEPSAPGEEKSSEKSKQDTEKAE